MAAIWGVVTNGELKKEPIELMTESMKVYVLDRVDTVEEDNMAMCCGHQYITNEAVKDISPIVDDSVVFLADCFLYNRDQIIKECFKLLPHEQEKLEKLGDAQIAFELYKLYGTEFVKKLRGAFAFVIYEKKINTVYLFTDHLMNRYLAYYYKNGILVFGSTYKPIKAYLNSELEVNDEFLANAYIDMSPKEFVLPDITVYRNVFHVNNGEYIKIDLEKETIKRYRYWNPLKKIRKIKQKTDDEYKDLFLSVYKDIVRGYLRARKNTGIRLSGGLDSSSVAALAAPMLAEKGEKLYSYTSVPAKRYESVNNWWRNEDESLLIEEQVKMNPNIIPHYISGDKGNCMDLLEYYQNLYDIPVLPSINNTDIAQMNKEAMLDDCSIIFGGGNGNATVSYGNIGGNILMSLQRGRLVSAFREAKAYCKIYRLRRTVFMREWMKAFITFLFCQSGEHYSFLKPSIINKYHLRKYEKKAMRKYGTNVMASIRQKKNFMFIPWQYAQKGFFYTNDGLIYGYLQVDPTLTVEMIEFCLGLPDKCFVKDGHERRLVRDYMKELIPEAITCLDVGKGIQAADFAFRVNRDWKAVKDKIIAALNEDILKAYLDEEKLKELVLNLINNEGNISKDDVLYATLLGSLSFFLKNNKAKNS